ncbi:hypothetical protein AB0395_36330 [Streptosporangium sp. NPDC051023]|uniref:hypothetical protein n=1 Tax=Streptosporangium sp. NPDC051023 TaxID=3155410 RepID=UPI00344BCDCE
MRISTFAEETASPFAVLPSRLRQEVKAGVRQSSYGRRRLGEGLDRIRKQALQAFARGVRVTAQGQ